MSMNYLVSVADTDMKTHQNKPKLTPLDYSGTITNTTLRFK